MVFRQPKKLSPVLLDRNKITTNVQAKRAAKLVLAMARSQFGSSLNGVRVHVLPKLFMSVGRKKQYVAHARKLVAVHNAYWKTNERAFRVRRGTVAFQKNNPGAVVNETPPIVRRYAAAARLYPKKVRVLVRKMNNT